MGKAHLSNAPRPPRSCLPAKGRSGFACTLYAIPESAARTVSATHVMNLPDAVRTALQKHAATLPSVCPTLAALTAWASCY